MSANVFILHGSFGSPFENWFPWIHNKLQENGTVCVVPTFPTPAGQTFSNWSKILDSYRDVGMLSSASTLVAHSSAAAFAVKYMVSRGVFVKKFVTVSGFNNFKSGNEGFDAINAEFYVDEAVVRECGRAISSVHCYFSSSDPYLPLSVLDGFSNDLGGVKHNIDGAGHFNDQAGYREFNEVYELTVS